jgi:hypothetical protein
MPKTFIVRDTHDPEFKKLRQYIRTHPDDVWMVKPGENSNRGKGIEIFTD